MTKLIKRIAKFDDIKLEKEFNNLTSQLINKEDALSKNKVTKSIKFDCTGTLKITVKDGQTTNIEVV